MDAANGAVTPGEKRSRLRRLYSSARTRRNGASRGKTERARESYRWLHRENTCETQEAALKEYEALRAEISASMQAQISLLAFGSTALGLVFAGASASADARARASSSSSSHRSSAISS